MELGFLLDLRKDGIRLDTGGVGLGFMDFMTVRRFWSN